MSSLPSSSLLNNNPPLQLIPEPQGRIIISSSYHYTSQNNLISFNNFTSLIFTTPSAPIFPVIIQLPAPHHLVAPLCKNLASNSFYLMSRQHKFNSALYFYLKMQSVCVIQDDSWLFHAVRRIIIQSEIPCYEGFMHESIE